jgi:hypothetical protein
VCLVAFPVPTLVTVAPPSRLRYSAVELHFLILISDISSVVEALYLHHCCIRAKVSHPVNYDGFEVHPRGYRVVPGSEYRAQPMEHSLSEIPYNKT